MSRDRRISGSASFEAASGESAESPSCSNVVATVRMLAAEGRSRRFPERGVSTVRLPRCGWSFLKQTAPELSRYDSLLSGVVCRGWPHRYASARRINGSASSVRLVSCSRVAKLLKSIATVGWYAPKAVLVDIERTPHQRFGVFEAGWCPVAVSPPSCSNLSPRLDVGRRRRPHRSPAHGASSVRPLLEPVGFLSASAAKFVHR